MKNWARNIAFDPKQILNPNSTETAQKIIKEHLLAKKSIRIRGSSHSWTPLVATKDSLLHLDHMQGIIKVDTTHHLVKVKAGTKLSLFGKESFKYKLALPNMGDIDSQSLTGAMSTGTHGTGITLQSLSNQIHDLTMITGRGEIVTLDADKNADLLKAASVSLGSMGLITEATIKMVPAYKLKVDVWSEDMDTCLSKVQSRISENRHFEIFYFPIGDWCYAKKMNITDEDETSFVKYKIEELILENWLYEILNYIAFKTNTYKKLNNLVRKFAGEKSYVRWSHKAFPAQRTVRFMEMEYNLPIEKFEEVFHEIKETILKHQFQTLFPIEIRFVKKDDLWLSPAYQRDSVYFAVHTYIKQEFKPYFDEMEKIFKRHGGRPHWGKWHSMTRKEFELVYPRWDDFIKVRSTFDPDGLWLNSYLHSFFD